MHKKARETLGDYYDSADEEGRRAIMAFARGEAARAAARRPKLALVTASSRPGIGRAEISNLVADKVQHG
jgi:hypothetical protein